MMDFDALANALQRPQPQTVESLGVGPQPGLPTDLEVAIQQAAIEECRTRATLDTMGLYGIAEDPAVKEKISVEYALARRRHFLATQKLNQLIQSKETP